MYWRFEVADEEFNNRITAYNFEFFKKKVLDLNQVWTEIEFITILEVFEVADYEFKIATAMYLIGFLRDQRVFFFYIHIFFIKSYVG